MVENMKESGSVTKCMVKVRHLGPIIGLTKESK